MRKRSKKPPYPATHRKLALPVSHLTINLQAVCEALQRPIWALNRSEILLHALA
jgi:hypothetical protein